ncbi:MAG TPA: glutathione S-transferase [Kofleriaceae bacterium]
MTKATTTKLITIPFSHYCEKARWALDRCGITYEEHGHLPLFHYLETLRVGRQRTVPILVDGKQVVRDSTDIVAWADAKRPGALIPIAGAKDVLAIEDDLDNHLGPATRRWGYFHLLPVREADQYITAGVPRWEKAMLGITRPLAVAMLRRGLKIDAAGAERSRQKIEDTFARIEQVIGDGRRYLAGDRFTVADLTFAALAAPVLLPPNHPVQTFDLALFSAAARDQVNAWRDRPAGQFALRLYAGDRVSLSAAA